MLEHQTKALLSIFSKEDILPLAHDLQSAGYQLLSTGGTHDYLTQNQLHVAKVEDYTSFPSILGGRVKTLHPKVFGGILARIDNQEDRDHLHKFEIPEIDVVVIDLYPFEETLQSGASHDEIIEKIDIGGISLLRAAAKNFNRTWVISSKDQYEVAREILQRGGPSLEERKAFAAQAFRTCFQYDAAIFTYFSDSPHSILPLESENVLRYGENPHQKGSFFGDLTEVFEQLHGKELSYNNLMDCDAAVQLMGEFKDTTFAVLKHNNACGVATRDNLTDAWKDALAGDPVSAFGGVLITNRKIDKETAEELHQIFFEVIMAPDYSDEALEILKQKKKRIILKTKEFVRPERQYRSLLNGFLAQEVDSETDDAEEAEVVTQRKPTRSEIKDLTFASKIAKHTKSNTITLAKNQQLIGSGMGQSSRVDALKQAIAKAKAFNLDLNGAVMASDAFFPFPDCVEIAQKEGVKAVIQPGGSIRDQQSVDYCNEHKMAMVTTGTRHFKH